jgi:hypothetical protein
MGQACGQLLHRLFALIGYDLPVKDAEIRQSSVSKPQSDTLLKFGLSNWAVSPRGDLFAETVDIDHTVPRGCAGHWAARGGRSDPNQLLALRHDGIILEGIEILDGSL